MTTTTTTLVVKDDNMVKIPIVPDEPNVFGIGGLIMSRNDLKSGVVQQKLEACFK
jgi:hypothetical protein